MAEHRLLLTGFSGFVGKTIADLVQENTPNDNIVLCPLCKPDGADVDIRDAEAVDASIAACEPNGVIHLAAVALPRSAWQHPKDAWEINLLGTFNLASAVMRHVPHARFVFAGSAEAYGQAFLNSGEPVSEDVALEPLSVYGATKAAADLMLAQMTRDGLRAIRFRPFNHTGPSQSPDYVVSAFARQIARIEKGWQEPVVHVGNLTARRDFLDVRDVAAAYLAAAKNPNERFETGAFNLATGRPVAIGDLLQALLMQSSVAAVIRPEPSLIRTNSIDVMSGNPRRTEEVLGWRASTPLETTLRDVLNYWRQLAQDEPSRLRDEGYQDGDA